MQKVLGTHAMAATVKSTHPISISDMSAQVEKKHDYGLACHMSSCLPFISALNYKRPETIDEQALHRKCKEMA